jgi:hypothetical protein
MRAAGISLLQLGAGELDAVSVDRSGSVLAASPCRDGGVPRAQLRKADLVEKMHASLLHRTAERGSQGWKTCRGWLGTADEGSEFQSLAGAGLPPSV